MPWARHDTAFTAALEDLVVHDAVVANKQAAADRCGLSWRAVDHACVRLAEEALGRIDLLDGLVAVAIDEVEYKKGQRYLTVVCDHREGGVGRHGPLQAGRRRVLRRAGPVRAAVFAVRVR